MALAASARPWADSLHRFLLDHGGARVRAVVMGPDEATNESYDVLVIDDVCSFLTPRLIEQVRRRGRFAVGVFDARDAADAKRRLLDCGVDDVIEEGATPEEFLTVIRGVLELAPYAPPSIEPRVAEESRGRVVVVGGPPGGCGASEVAIALAQDAGAILVDGDDVAPALAQRLGAPLLPNLRTAIDIVHHRPGPLEEAVVRTPAVKLVPGLAMGDEWSQLHPGEVEAVIDELAATGSAVVVNVGAGLERPEVGEGRFGLARGLIRLADRVVAVGLPQPVAITRLVRWVTEAKVLSPDADVLVVVNRAGRSSYQRAEVEAELARALPESPVLFVPEDRRVTEAAWAGKAVPRGPFRRAVGKLAKAAGL